MKKAFLVFRFPFAINSTILAYWQVGNFSSAGVPPAPKFVSGLCAEALCASIGVAVDREGKAVKNFLGRKWFPVLFSRENLGTVNRPNLLVDLRSELVLGNFQIIGSLEIQPVTRAGLEIARQPQSSISGDASPLVNDLGDSRDRNVQIKGQPVHAQTEWLEIVFTKNFTRMD
jgi:hypothetical protein